jgi:hypothetical protein
VPRAHLPQLTVQHIYLLDRRDQRCRRGGLHSLNSDLVPVSVSNPPSKGTERHDVLESGASSY